jgi:vacuole morphology and inheritance protein 14
MSNKANHSYNSSQGAPAELPALDQPPPLSSSGMRRSGNPGMNSNSSAKMSSASSVNSSSNNSNIGNYNSNNIRPAASNLSAGTSSSQQHQTLSVERSPLPPMILRSLGDRSNEKRKNAALEIEALVKDLQEANNLLMIQNVIEILSKDFCTSMNSNYRKGGLVGLAATGIGLMGQSRTFLPVLLPPVLHCFDDPESRVRYYACESLYNIAKVSRQGILQYFNQIFEGLTKVIADVDLDVKNGAQLLDRLIKDIVTEADEAFQVDQFLPLLQKYIQRTNPYIRQLIVGWVTLLDSVPDISMLDYLPDFLDGVFNMLSDSNREIRQAADSALSEFLKELTSSTVVEFGPIVSILVLQCQSKERLNRLTATTWLSELIHHPYSGGDALLPYHSEILGAIMCCISDGEMEIRMVAERTDDDLLNLVKGTRSPFELISLLETLTSELLNKEDVPTKMAALRWINMLMEKRKANMNAYIEELLPVLIRTLSDPSDAVVLLNLQVLSRISLAQRDERGDVEESEEEQFELVLNAILSLFAKDRQLLETRGSLIIRKLCVLLNAKSVYIRLANALMQYEKVNGQAADAGTLEFVSTMVQTLNLILLTASELHDLRSILSKSFISTPDDSENSGDDAKTPEHGQYKSSMQLELKRKQWSRQQKNFIEDSLKVFVILFRCWSHNPVATFSLCLLAQAYDLSFALVKRFSKMEDVSVGFLMQIDKLVYLLESPIFVHLRLKLLDVESESHAQLLKSIYGILLCLPQGDAFRLLNNRLTTVCNLRDNLGLKPLPDGPTSPQGAGRYSPSQKNGRRRFPLSLDALLIRYDEILEMHKVAQEQYDNFVHDEQQRLQMQMGGPGAQQIGMSGSSNGGRSHGAVIANGPMSPQYHGQLQYDRRLWE